MFVGKRTRFLLIVTLSATPFHLLLPHQPRFPIQARAAYPWFHLAICVLSRPQPRTSGSIPRMSFERPHTATHAASSAASRYASQRAGQLLQWRLSFVADQVSARSFDTPARILTASSPAHSPVFELDVRTWVEYRGAANERKLPAHQLRSSDYGDRSSNINRPLPAKNITR